MVMLKCFLTCFMLGAVLFVSATAVADSGSPARQIVPESPNDITEKTGLQEGWLILNGQLLERPYTLERTESGVSVNGRGVLEPPSYPQVISVSDETAARHELSVTFWKQFYGWVDEEGIDLARSKAVAFMQAQPIVESAALAGENELRIKYKGLPFEERLYLEKKTEARPDLEDRRQKYADDYYESLNRWLEKGCLVIISDGVLMVTPPSEGESTVKSIKSIISSQASTVDKLESLKAIVPDRAMAKRIVNSFEIE